MAACRACRTELDGVGCPRCSPTIDDFSVFHEIERSPKWREARVHRVGSRHGKTLIWIGVVTFIGLALLYPSYSDARAEGDDSGTILMIVMTCFGALFLIPGILFQLVKLRPEPAVVLATAWDESTDSEGGTTSHYYLHARTRSRPLVLSCDYEQLARLEMGAPIIAFVRGSSLDDLWLVDNVATVVAPPKQPARSAPAAPPASAPTSAPAPASTSTATEPAARLAALDPVAVATAEAKPVKRPTVLYLGALLWAGAAIIVMVIPPLVDLGSDPAECPDEHCDERMRIMKIVAVCIGVAMLGLAAWLARRARKKPIIRDLVVILDRRVTRRGANLETTFEVLDAKGQHRSMTARLGVAGPLHTPLVACSIDGTVVETHRV